jgi:hypothetical protein
VRQAVVTAQPDPSGEQRLVAYLVPASADAPAVSDLRAGLKERLPDYMIPSLFQCLDAFPLTPNGKVDRKALPVPDAARPRLDASYIVPRNALEQAIAGVWESVLGISGVGVFDNFFDLGGHSLLLVKAHTALQSVATRPVSIVDLFRYPTIDALARFLSESPDAASVAMTATQTRAGRLREAAARQKARHTRRGTA